MDTKESLPSVIFSGFLAGACWGLAEAVFFHTRGFAPPGSGDPWFYVEGLVLYGLFGILVSGIARGLIFREAPPGAGWISPFFALTYLVCAVKVHQAFFPGARVLSVPVLAEAAILLALFLFLFRKSFRTIESFFTAKRRKIAATVFLIVEIGVLFWFSPLIQRSREPIGSPVRRMPNLVLITLDTTRRDHLSLYGYDRNTTPHLDQFARAGIVFDNAYSVSSWTLPSHASMFTGKIPTAHGASWSHWWVDSSETTMAEILHSAGYATAGFVSGPFLLSSLNIAQGFDYYNDQLDFAGGMRNYQLVRLIKSLIPFKFRWMDGQRGGKELTDLALSWIQRQNRKAPFFLFLNYFDPHDPYRPPPPYDQLYGSNYRGPMTGFIRGLYSDRRTGERRIGGKNGPPLTAEDYQKLRDLYDGEIRFMDDQIGRLLEYFNNTKMTSNTLFIIAGDHGESIGDHKLIDHGHTLYQEQIRIPMMLVGPGFTGGKRIQSLVRNIDVLPTLLEALRINGSLRIQGKSFLPYLNNDQDDGRKYVGEVSDDPRTRVQPFQRDLKAVIDGGWKFFWSSKKTNQLFDLNNDPTESLDLISTGEHDASRLQQFLQQYLQTVEQKNASTQQNIDESTLESIKSNNYVN